MAGSHGGTARMYLFHGSGRRGATGGGCDSSWAGRGTDWEFEGLEGSEGEEGEEAMSGGRGEEGLALRTQRIRGGEAVRKASVNWLSVQGVLSSLLGVGGCELWAESGMVSVWAAEWTSWSCLCFHRFISQMYNDEFMSCGSEERNGGEYVYVKFGEKGEREAHDSSFESFVCSPLLSVHLVSHRLPFPVKYSGADEVRARLKFSPHSLPVRLPFLHTLIFFMLTTKD